MRLYKCNDTGLMFEDINNSDNCLELSFCAIKGYVPKEHEEGLTEKHIPTYERKGNDLVVTIGSTPHPMTEDHYIEYVELETNKGFYRKSPTKDPVVTFRLEDGEEILNIYAFCNIHGLWIKKGKEEKKTMNKRYKCNTCGNVVEMVNDAGVVPHCCGQEMTEVKEDK